MKKTITIRKYLTLILITTLSFIGFAQEIEVADATKFEIDKYKTELISAKYSEKFKTDEEKFDFKKLRDFLNEKEILKKRLIFLLDQSYVEANQRSINQKKINELKGLIKDQKPEDIIDMRYYIYNEVSPPPKETVKEVIRKIKLIEYSNSKNEQDIKNNQIFLSQNISNVKQDIQDCQNQIDTALDPDNRRQEFKSIVSSYFVGLISLILICFFSIIYLRSDFTLSKDLLSGYGLQFITLFVLIIAIILFGILDILKGSELAAMLSGISGYILGKGIQDKKSISDSTIVDPKLPTTPVTVITDSIIPVIPPNPDLAPIE
ncbi:hypothetical protein AR687_08830 [Flavobacteriaceae bacterium CRH]|nr:hypothetical protein AR687_08830 [Flavobacteriaceae bacterium CRH]